MIIDEAHERSLNIDFILGYLRQLLPRRPDLKVIITSATIDPERFAGHFSTTTAPGRRGLRPHLPGRGPLPPRQRPGRRRRQERLAPSTTPTRSRRSATPIDELLAERPGDILVFLSGEREIRDTADALKGRPGLEVLPLYARLSAAEQHRVFEPPASKRRAAASCWPPTSPRPRLTVPGIRYVIDPGTARISPLQPPHQGAAAAHRARLAGLRQPAQGPLRAGRRRHLHPAVLAGGLRRPPGVHRPGDPAHQPRLGHPADGRRSAWATSRRSRSSTRRTRAAIDDGVGSCWRSSTR